MNTKWFKGLRGEAKEQRKRELVANKRALEILAEVLEGELKEMKSPDYSSAGWAYHAADINGHNKALQDVLNLINLKD